MILTGIVQNMEESGEIKEKFHFTSFHYKYVLFCSVWTQLSPNKGHMMIEWCVAGTLVSQKKTEEHCIMWSKEVYWQLMAGGVT